MLKLLAVVTVCGIWQGHNRACIEITDQNWYASRPQCMVRAQELVKTIKTLTWYASVKLEKNPVPKCVEK